MKRWKLNLPVALLFLAVLIIVIIRVRLLTIPLERDEGEFAYGGQLILQGIAPYKLFYNMKFPGIYAAYAALMALFGQSPAGIHFGLLLLDLANTFFVYRLARNFQGVPAAAVAAAAYAFLSTSPIVVGTSAHATHFVVAAALAGLLVLLRAERSGKLALFFASGFLLSIACLMKQPGALFWLLGFVLLPARAVLDRPQWRIHCQRLALYAAGGAIPFILTALVLWQTGVFGRFWFWAVTYARAHAAQYPLSIGLQNLSSFIKTMSPTADGFFWIVAALGLLSLFLVKGEPLKKIWLTAFFVFSCLAVAASNYFTRHYFVLLLPVLSLLIGEAVSAALQWTMPLNSGRSWPAWLFLLMWPLSVFHHRHFFFTDTPDQASRRLYPGNPFVECQEIGRHLGENSSPDATIAVLGSEPEIFFYARRHSATGYIYMYDFYKPQAFAADMQREMIAQIEQAGPEYLVFVLNPVSWYLSSDTPRVEGSLAINWFPKYAKQFYNAVGLVITKPDPEYNWGTNALNHPAFRGPFISIFKRK